MRTRTYWVGEPPNPDHVRLRGPKYREPALPLHRPAELDKACRKHPGLHTYDTFYSALAIKSRQRYMRDTYPALSLRVCDIHGEYRLYYSYNPKTTEQEER